MTDNSRNKHNAANAATLLRLAFIASIILDNLSAVAIPPHVSSGICRSQRPHPHADTSYRIPSQYSFAFKVEGSGFQVWVIGLEKTTAAAAAVAAFQNRLDSGCKTPHVPTNTLPNNEANPKP